MTDHTAFEWFEALAGVYKGLPSPALELIKGIVTRSMIIDYAVLDLLSGERPTAVIDLGCGFSTRYHRLRPKVGMWAHIDLREVLEARVSFGPLRDHEIVLMRDFTDEVTLIPAGQIYICEGVFNHLPREKAKALVETLCNSSLRGVLIGTAVYDSALERMKGNQEGLGTTFPIWGLSDLFNLDVFLKPARVQRTWLLGPRDDEASGVVFLAKL